MSAGFWAAGGAILLVALLFVCAPAEASLIGHWTFDDSSNRGGDSGPNGLTGSFVGSPSFTTGKIGGALAFHGGSDGMYLTSFPSGVTARELTVLWWVNVPASPALWNDWWEVVASGWYVGEISDNNGVAAPGRPALYSTLAGAGAVQGSAAPDLRNAGWHCLTATCSTSANQLALYLDGTLWGSGTWSATSAVTGFSVGYARSRGGRNINSAIDDVQLYDTALSADQVRFLAQNPGLTTDAPEPASLALLGLGGLALLRRRRAR